MFPPTYRGLAPRVAALSSYVLLSVFAACAGSNSNVVSEFGPEKGEITGRVWRDFDRDGIQDLGEPGIPGVVIQIQDGNGTQIRGPQATTVDGLYLFRGLPEGSYTLTIDVNSLPLGFVASPCDQGSDDTKDNDCSPVTVALEKDEVDDTVDFGFHSRFNGAIGDFVWHDQNCNGLQDAGEPGLNGVRIMLKDDTGTVIDEETTARSRQGQNGHFLFEPLPAGTYTVEVDMSTLPPNFNPAPCNVGNDDAIDNDCSGVQVILLSNDAKNTTVDFGFCGKATDVGRIGNLVWLDKNGDGCQDPGEKGIPAVDVSLFVKSVKVASTTTDDRGEYEFAGLPAGTYTVAVDETTLPKGLMPSPREACNDTTRDSNGSPAMVNLPENDTIDRTIDFGYTSRGKDQGFIGDRVWEDKNGNGLQDPGEPDIVNVRILLRDAATTRIIAESRTELNIGYGFRDLPAGKYIVEVDDKTLPKGLKPSPCNVGTNPKIDSDCSPVTIDLQKDEKRDDVDFGYYEESSNKYGSIGDFVWNDQNGNGLQDDGEPGFAEVRVILKDNAGKVLATQLTDEFGIYEFDKLKAGTYRLEIDPKTCPPGYRASPCEVGTNRAIDSNCSPAIVTIGQGEENPTIDFGFVSVCTLTIGDYVWFDENGDGLQDASEHGIESVRILLKNSKGTVIDKTFTDEDGEYQFAALCEGTYRVEIDPSSLPSGLVPSPSSVGSDRTKDSNGSPAVVKLSASDHSIDFGFKRDGGGPRTGFEGCSSSFWKKNTNLWPVSPDTMFSSVFADAFPGATLYEVIRKKGGGPKSLGRDTVAAYLNAKSTQVAYPLTVAEIQTLFNRMYKGNKKVQDALRKFFEKLNKLGCPLK